VEVGHPVLDGRTGDAHSSPGTNPNYRLDQRGWRGDRGFTADQYFSGGTTYTNTATIDMSQIPTNPPPAAVLNTERYGTMTYTIPSPHFLNHAMKGKRT
jgi:hypothetical protein